MKLFADDLAPRMHMMHVISIGRRRYGTSATASCGHRIVSTFRIIGKQMFYKKWLQLGPVLQSAKTQGGKMRSVLSHGLFVRVVSFLFVAPVYGGHRALLVRGGW